MTIQIKKAAIQDAKQISLLTKELGYSASENQTKEWLPQLLNSSTHCVLVAQNEDGQLCGWAVVEKRISLETGCKAEISGLVTSANFRRLGVGKQLVLACENWAAEHQLEKLVVASNIQREESHSFYQSIGFLLKKTSHKYEKVLTQKA